MNFSSLSWLKAKFFQSGPQVFLISLQFFRGPFQFEKYFQSEFFISKLNRLKLEQHPT